MPNKYFIHNFKRKLRVFICFVRISKYLSCSAAFKNLSTAFQLTPFHHTLALPYGCFRTISTSFKMFLPYIGSSFFLLWCPQHKCNDMLFHLTRKILFGTFHDSSKSQPCSPTIFEQAYCTRSYIFGVFALPQLNLEPFKLFFTSEPYFSLCCTHVPTLSSLVPLSYTIQIEKSK